MTAPRQPRNPISIVRDPTPTRMYAPVLTEGDEVSAEAKRRNKLATDKYDNCHHHLENYPHKSAIFYKNNTWKHVKYGTEDYFLVF